MKNNRCRDAKITLPFRSRVWLFGSCLFIFVLYGNPARAENLPDPTRPPAELGAPAIAVVHSGPVLQSVLISPVRKAAIISGEAISLGGQYGKGRVVKISESEVVLNNGGNLQTLRLFPEVEMKTSTSGPATKKKARRAGKRHGEE
ncbi:MAG: hypothetical protein ACREUY_04020 [Burkholderiales bacterium]